MQSLLRVMEKKELRIELPKGDEYVRGMVVMQSDVKRTEKSHGNSW